MKKGILTIVATAMMVGGCATKNEQKTIQPVSNEETAYMTFNEEAQEKYVELEGVSDVVEMPKQFLNVGSELPDVDVLTYDDQTINLSDYKGKKIVMEIVSINCNFCREQAQYLEDIKSKNEDAVVMQVFLEGKKDDTGLNEKGETITVDSIKAFYEAAGAEISDDIVITQANEEINNYVVNELGMENYPTYLLFDESGKLAYYHSGELSRGELQTIINNVFEEKFCFYNNLADGLKNANDYIRTWENVKTDFDEDIQKQVSSENEETFYSNVEKTVDISGKITDAKGNEIDLDALSGNLILAFIDIKIKDGVDDEEVRKQINEINKLQKDLENDTTVISIFYSSDFPKMKNFFNSLKQGDELRKYIEGVDGYVFESRYDLDANLRKLKLFEGTEIIIIDLDSQKVKGAYIIQDIEAKDIKKYCELAKEIN